MEVKKMEWNEIPNVKELFKRIMIHRQTCQDWKNGNPCFNCHFGLLHKIEEELNLGRWSFEME